MLPIGDAPMRMLSTKPCLGFVSEKNFPISDYTVPKSMVTAKEYRWLAVHLYVPLLHIKQHKYRFCEEYRPSEEYIGTVCAYRNDVRKAKDQVELNLARQGKGSQKGFSKYVGDERRTRANSDLLLKKTGNLVTQDMERLRYGMPPSR